VSHDGLAPQRHSIVAVTILRFSAAARQRAWVTGGATVRGRPPFGESRHRSELVAETKLRLAALEVGEIERTRDADGSARKLHVEDGGHPPLFAEPHVKGRTRVERLSGGDIERGAFLAAQIAHRRRARGPFVRKDEKGTLVVHADKILRKETDVPTGHESEHAIPFMKGYTVFPRADRGSARALLRQSRAAHRYRAAHRGSGILLHRDRRCNATTESRTSCVTTDFVVGRRATE
jgi:hypothetical protein